MSGKGWIFLSCLVLLPGGIVGAAPEAWADVSGSWSQAVLERIAESEYELGREEQPALPGLGAALQAPNRAHGFRTWFTNDGIRLVPRSDPGDDTDGGVNGPTWEWALRLARWGGPGLPRDAAPARLTVEGNEIEYDRGALVERYVNDRRGLEQVLVDVPQASAYSGSSVSTAGDVNGDGYSDIIVGAPGDENGQTDEGRAYLYLGPYVGPGGSGVAWTAEGDQAGANFGASVAAAGDCPPSRNSDRL